MFTCRLRTAPYFTLAHMNGKTQFCVHHTNLKSNYYIINYNTTAVNTLLLSVPLKPILLLALSAIFIPWG